MRLNLRTPKASLLAVFLVLLGVGSAALGWRVVLPHMLAAVLGSSLTDLAVARFERRRLGFPSSALLSGMIIGFVLGPTTPWPVTVMVGVLATLSKYLLATDRWHIFNPAGLALLVSVPLFGTGQSWWGSLPDLPWPFLVVVFVGGGIIIDRINKFPLVLAFLGTVWAVFACLGAVNPAPVAELFRPPFMQATVFLALFMLTDPPTSPSRYGDQVVVGVLVGGASCLAEVLGAGESYLLVGLLAGNVALAVRRWAMQRRRHVRRARSVQRAFS